MGSLHKLFLAVTSVIFLYLFIFSSFTYASFSFSPQERKSSTGDSLFPILSSISSEGYFEETKKPITSPLPFCVTVPVIMYHHVEPLAVATKEGHAQLTVDSSIFESQMRYLSERGYHTLTADELVQSLLLKQPLRGKNIVLTFDDGYADWYPYVYPVLQKYNLIGNFFISSGLLNKPGYLTVSELKEMANSSYVSVYNHTSQHIDIGYAASYVIEQELQTSSTMLEMTLNKHINVFAYPYGSYSAKSIQILKEQGFIAAFTTVPGKRHCDTALMTLPRDHVGNVPLWSYGL